MKLIMRYRCNVCGKILRCWFFDMRAGPLCFHLGTAWRLWAPARARKIHRDGS